MLPVLLGGVVSGCMVLSCWMELNHDKFTVMKSGDNINILTFVCCSEQIRLFLRFNISTSTDAYIFLVENNKSECRINHIFLCLRSRNRHIVSHKVKKRLFTLFLQVCFFFCLLRNFARCFDRMNTAK